MLCQKVPPLATATTGNKASWNYHLALITHARRFLAVSKSNTLADTRPEIDAVPVTVLLETATVLRCSLPPTPDSPVLDTIHIQILCHDITNVGTGFTYHATQKPSTIPLYELSSQKHTTLLAVGDGGADVPKNYGSFGWILSTEHEILWECKGIARGYPMQSYRAERYGRISLISFTTHYSLYLEIQTSATYDHFLLRQP
jgi:hypothetical protein